MTQHSLCPVDEEGDLPGMDLTFDPIIFCLAEEAVVRNMVECLGEVHYVDIILLPLCKSFH